MTIFIAFLLCVLIFLLYSLFKILGKNVGFGSSPEDDHKKWFGNFASTQEQIEGPKSNGKDEPGHPLPRGEERMEPPVTQNTVVRLDSVDMTENDILKLKSLDRGLGMGAAQRLVDGFYLMAQELIDQSVAAVFSETSHETGHGTDSRSGAPGSSGAGMGVAPGTGSGGKFSHLRDYLSQLKPNISDVEFIAFRLQGLKDIDIQSQRLLFRAHTACVFNLYDNSQSHHMKVFGQDRVTIIWYVAANMHSWPKRDIQILELRIAKDA